MADDIPAELLFSATFPLPFRALSLAGLGILGWATNLNLLQLAGLDGRFVLDLDHYDVRYGRRPISPLPLNNRAGAGWKYYQNVATLYKPIYRLFIAYALWTFASWSVYRYATFGDIYRVDAFKFIPAVAMLVVLMVLVSPFHIFAKSERDRFLYAINRCLFPPRHRIHFSDIVFADVFTSFAKVLGDIWLSFCMLMPGGSLLTPPVQEGLARWILPTLMSLPYAVRLRQCLIDYRSPTNDSRRPLFNALKYATSFPVIYLSAAQRIVVSESIVTKGGTTAHSEHALFRLWLFAAAVNSLYSFWWDVTNDWGFDLLLPRSSISVSSHHGTLQKSSAIRPLVLPRLHSPTARLTPQPTSVNKDVDNLEHPPLETESKAGVSSLMVWYPYGLRSRLLFPLSVYPFAIVADLVLRLTWSAKLSSHLHAFAEGDMLIYCLELAEVIRRWMWVFLRVEWEVVKVEGEAHSRSPPATAASQSVGEDEYEMVPSDHSGFMSPDG